MIGLITIAGSTYLIIYADKIYPYLTKYLSVFERKGKKVDENKNYTETNYDAILFGYNRIGFDILNAFQKIQKKFLVIDYDPETIRSLRAQGTDCRYGDADNSELIDELKLSKIKMAISTIPKLDTNLLLINKIKAINPEAIVIAVSHQIDEALKLYNAGVTYVILPHFLGGHYVSDMIKKYGLNTNEFLKTKVRHIKHLNKRQEI